MISNKCHYGLRAMLELACQEQQRPLSICAIADRQNIPSRFLEAILRQLKQAGLTESVRGKEGGYRLAKPAADISMGEIIHLFEGSLLCGKNTAEVGKIDVFQKTFAQASDALSETFDNTSFSDLAQQYQKQQQAQTTNYSI